MLLLISLAALSGESPTASSPDVPARYEAAWVACRNDKLDFSAESTSAELRGCEALIAADAVDDEVKAIAHTNLGMLMSQASFFVTAKDELDTAIKLNPRLAPAYYNRALLHQSINEPDLAIRDYASAIGLNPKMVEAFANRGIIYAQSGKIDLAIADFTKEIELEPNVIDGYSNRGIARARSGQLEAALTDFDRAIALAPNDPQTYEDRARLYRKMGRESDAVADEAKAAALPKPQ
jgi:tetratricopeptide (TPR) repeat protein